MGSLGQETLKLLRALAVDADTTAPRRNGADAGSPDADAHVCTTSWCPVCQVVGFVKTNPDVVEEVAVAALHLARTVRDAFETALRQDQGGHDTSDRRTDEGEASR